jgi:Flp pilus assembly protein TadG
MLRPSLGRPAPCARRRSGTAVVEAALVMPLVIVLTLGCIDFARAIHQQIAMSNVARVGAEYGATHPFSTGNQATWESNLRAAMATEAACLPAFTPAHLQIEISTSGTSRTDKLVTVSARYPFTAAVRWPGLPQQVSLGHTAVMRQYR